MKQLQHGFWCLHCERAWDSAVIGSGEFVECPDSSCDGGAWDMFPIDGPFVHGESAAIYSERFSQLRARFG